MTAPRTRNATLLAAAAAAAVALLAPAPAAHAASARPHLSWVKCYRLCQGKQTVTRGGTIKLAGHNFRPGMRIVFRASTGSGTRTVKTQYSGRTRLLARVPANARSGRVYLTAKHGVRTNSSRTLHVKASSKPRPPRTGSGGSPSGTAFDGTAMWIWNLPKSSGGNPAAIVAQAKAHGIRSVFVKSGDGTHAWSQFTPQLVQELKAGGLSVCAWQYVYGSDPTGEARVAAQSVQMGADCFVIDAESEYEGRYAQAQTFTRALRQAVGPDYPIGLSSFPYVDYHPALPYSEFLAPGGAQFDVPQVYWKAIGDTVDASLDHTYRYNRPYGRAIVPVGQAYDGTSSQDVVRFRQVVGAQGSAGLSWWDWESASSSNFSAIGQSLPPFSGVPASDYALVTRGAKNDLVTWAQEHLQSAGQQLAVDGDFGPATSTAVRNFQAAKGLPVTGQIDTATWRALVDGYAPAPQTWSRRGKAKASAASATTGPAKSAGLPARRYEIPRGTGAGR